MELFRGLNLEHYPESRRQLLLTLQTGIPADWTFGGLTGVVARYGFLNCSIFHTLYNFQSDNDFLKKHFCSFSSELEIAQNFARIDEDGYYHNTTSPSQELIENAKHVIFVVNIANRVPQPGGSGIFINKYNNDRNKILVVNTNAYLSSELARRLGATPRSFTPEEATHWESTIQDIQSSIELSNIEKEWYILSLDSKDNNLTPARNPEDFSSITFAGDIISYRFYMPFDYEMI